MALLGERIPARRALEWGLVTQVTADAGFADAVDALAERLATGPTRASAGAKRALDAALFADLEAQLEREAAIQEELAASEDVEEGVRAFLAKRDARFAGH
jgi:2-(1,2-epoxy-1,2-dihydrophenyl)acetyl-CoA isomerase